MHTIYKPKGRAQEYAESSPGANDGYALNLYSGCTHACTFCYVPLQPPWSFKPLAKAEFHKRTIARPGLLPDLEKKAAQFPHKDNPLHLCFTCDPYPASCDINITRAALQVLRSSGFTNVQILTKGGLRARPHFGLMAEMGCRFGCTVVALSDDYYAKHEPLARSRFDDRREALVSAQNEYGLATWVSMEPVLNPADALRAIEHLIPYVAHWKIGKLNHGAEISEELGEIEASADWAGFVRDVKKLLPRGNYMLKKSLQKFEDPTSK